jgi:hypothetical protein
MVRVDVQRARLHVGEDRLGSNIQEWEIGGGASEDGGNNLVPRCHASEEIGQMHGIRPRSYGNGRLVGRKGFGKPSFKFFNSGALSNPSAGNDPFDRPKRSGRNMRIK